LRSWVGYKQGIFKYERGERFAGEPKYRLKTLIYLALDCLTSFSYLPLRMITSMGFIVFFLGLFFALYTLLNRLFNPGIVEGYTTIEISILVLGGGSSFWPSALSENISQKYLMRPRNGRSA
jgi:hypothetical protein